MTTRLFPLAALALAIATPAQARDWELANVSEDHSGAMFVDIDSIKVKDGAMREAEIYIVLRADNQNIAALQSLLLIDCAGARKRSQWWLGFDAGGRVVTQEPAETEWIPMKEGTLFGRVLERVCKGPPATPNQRFGANVPLDQVRARLNNPPAAN